MTEPETEEVARSAPVEAGSHCVAGRDIHADRPQGDLGDVGGDQRPNPVAEPRKGHAHARVTEHIAADIDRDEEPEAQLPREQGLTYSVEAVEGEQQGD